MTRLMFRIFTLLGALLLAGCVSQPMKYEQVNRFAIEDLAEGIMALGPGIDPEEAYRAAHISITYAQQLKREYGVTDPPIVHNMKVNSGLRPRGLCYHWAEDMEARLKEEDFRTLQVHRAIANAFSRNPFEIEHSTAVISRKGDTMEEGMVLDPWRFGGIVFWSPVPEDPKYVWEPRLEVLAEKYERRQAEAARNVRYARYE